MDSVDINGQSFGSNNLFLIQDKGDFYAQVRTEIT